MPARRHLLCLLLAILATAAVAQTEYELSRDPAMQRLGAQLQAGRNDDARRDVAVYLEQFPGDAVMQYNLACLEAMAGDPAAALDRLGTALAAGYRDLARPLHDPDLFVLADDPRLTALLDRTRADLVAAMQAAEIYLDEGVWSEPQVLAPDRFGPGDEIAPGRLRVRHDPAGLTVEIAPPPAGADEVIVCVALPRSLDEHETRRWFEFRSPLNAPGPVVRSGRHGRADPAPAAGELTVAGGISTLHLPWSSLHPYRPPVELVLGLDVTLRRATGSAPADRWALIPDPNAGSAIIPWRRFAPLILDPGPAPARLIAGRLDTYLVVGDSLSVELGIQGLPGGDVHIGQTVDDRADTAFTAALEPDLAYRTLDYRLPAEPATGWFTLAAAVTPVGGDPIVWSDRGFRLQPDWFLVQAERLAGVPASEQSIVSYELMRTLRGQQQFQPHDDPSIIAAAALRAGELIDRAEATGSVLPAESGVFAAAFPVGEDLLQACQLVLPEAARRRDGSLVMVVTTAGESADAVAAALGAGRDAGDPRTFVVVPVQAVPGRPDLGAATVRDATGWARSLAAAPAVALVGIPGAGSIALAATGAEAYPLLWLGRGPAAQVPANVTIIEPAGDDAAAWAAAILAWH